MAQPVFVAFRDASLSMGFVMFSVAKVTGVPFVNDFLSYVVVFQHIISPPLL